MIRVTYIGDGVNDIDSMARRMDFIDASFKDNMVWDEEDPQYVVVNEQMYVDSRYFNRFCSYYKSHGEKRVFIYIGGEAISPDMNLFDYAIVYNRKMIYEDRISRIPTNYLHSTGDKFRNEISTREMARRELSCKKKFCNFIYSNSHANEMRDQLFFEISKYKFVESLGEHLNNMGNVPTRGAVDWKKQSIELKKDYKFTIASENAFFEGYTSEKLTTTFEAHSVPIYWGNPDIAEEYNEKAFINVHSFKNMHELIAKVKQIDENDELWLDMICQPWQTEEQFEIMNRDMNTYREFLEHVFQDNVLKSQRRSMGTASDNYFKFFLVSTEHRI